MVDFFVMAYSVAAGLEDIEDNRDYGEDQTISFVNGKYDVSAQPLEYRPNRIPKGARGSPQLAAPTWNVI